jgi:hypothetical protein
MKLFEAIYELNPTVVTINNDVAYDADGNEVAYDKAQAEALVQANQYKINRAKEYPSYADQFDKIFHEGIDAWKAEIQAVKDKYPKGEQA